MHRRRLWKEFVNGKASFCGERVRGKENREKVYTNEDARTSERILRWRESEREREKRDETERERRERESETVREGRREGHRDNVEERCREEATERNTDRVNAVDVSEPVLRGNARGAVGPRVLRVPVVTFAPARM